MNHRDTTVHENPCLSMDHVKCRQQVKGRQQLSTKGMQSVKPGFYRASGVVDRAVSARVRRPEHTFTITLCA
jgi:hypothetical protein